MPIDFEPKTILVFTSSDLVGDGLIKLPFLRGLRAAFPEARITWMTGNGTSEYALTLKPLVESLIDEVISNAGIGLGWKQLFALRPFPDRHFDVIVDLQRRVVASLHARRIAHRRFVSGAMAFGFSDLIPEDAYAIPPRFIDQCLRLLSLISGKSARSLVPSDPVTMAPEWRNAAAEMLPAGPVYVGFAPGARGTHKCWPIERFLAVAKRQVAAGRVPVFFLGPLEENLVDRARAALPGAIFPLQDSRAAALGPSPLLTIALAQRLTAALANDSGAGHMFAVGGAPLVSLFGPTPPEKFAPAGPRAIVIRAQSFGGTAMTFIPVDPVAGALDRLIAGGR